MSPSGSDDGGYGKMSFCKLFEYCVVCVKLHRHRYVYRERHQYLLFRVKMNILKNL